MQLSFQLLIPKEPQMLNAFSKLPICGVAALMSSALLPLFAADLNIEGESIVAEDGASYDYIYIGQTTTDPDALSAFIVNEGVSVSVGQTLKVANTADSAGRVDLIVKGEIVSSAGYNNFAVRADDDSSGNAANVYIEIGENASLNGGTWFNINGNNVGTHEFTSVDDFTGTLVKWDLAEDGSSGIIYGNNQNCSFAAYLVLDFTNVDLSAGSSGGSMLAQSYRPDQAEPGGSLRSDGGTEVYALIDGDYIKLTLNGETVIGDLTIELSNLGWGEQELSYTFSVAAVPEPAAYAAAFGALALAFAAYRRRS